MRTSSDSTVSVPNCDAMSKTVGSVCDANSELVKSELSGGLVLFSEEATARQAPAAVQQTAMWFTSVEKQMLQQWTNLQFGKVQPANVL